MKKAILFISKFKKDILLFSKLKKTYLLICQLKKGLLPISKLKKLFYLFPNWKSYFTNFEIEKSISPIWKSYLTWNMLFPSLERIITHLGYPIRQYTRIRKYIYGKTIIMGYSIRHYSRVRKSMIYIMGNTMPKFHIS